VVPSTPPSPSMASYHLHVVNHAVVQQQEGGEAGELPIGEFSVLVWRSRRAARSLHHYGLALELRCGFPDQLGRPST
jgi:hypothetical protein